MPLRDDLVMQRAARGRLAGVRSVALRMRVRLIRRRHPVDAVFLDFAGGDRREAHRAEKLGQVQVQAQSRLVAFDPTRAALAFGDDLVFALELCRRLPEGLLGKQRALAVFVAQREIPVLGKFLGELKALVLGRGSPVSTGEICGALPVAAV